MDVVTVSDAGVGITGALGLTGDLTVLGDASVTGDLVVGGAQVGGAFLTPVVTLYANRTLLYQWLAQYNGSGSFCFLKRVHAGDQNYNGESSNCQIYTLQNPDDGNTPWWRSACASRSREVQALMSSALIKAPGREARRPYVRSPIAGSPRGSSA